MNSGLNFIFSLLLITGTAIAGQAQIVPDTVLSNGVRFGFDVGRIAHYYLSNQTNRSYEGSVDVGFRRQLFVLEAGTSALRFDEPTYSYFSDGVFVRLGVERNLLKSGDDVISYGGRYAVSRFSYEADNISIEDNYWGTQILELPTQRAMAHWLEGTGSIKVNAWNNIYVGFTVRLKIRLAETGFGEVQPLEIPGFGGTVRQAAVTGDPYRRVAPGFNYYVYYRIPFRRGR